MTVRRLPLILILGGLEALQAPIHAAAQQFYITPSQRTDGTPSDREAANGVFKPRKPAIPGQKPGAEVGDVQVVAARTQGVRPEDAAALYIPQPAPYSTDPPPPKTSPPAADREPRPKAEGAPVDSSSQDKALPPGTDPRQVRPAEAFPPERIETSPAPKDDPRSLEERKNPGG